MRLLQLHDNGQYGITAELPSKDIPPYAILSHTWGNEEVVFADLSKPTQDWQNKSGFNKIRFCAEQANRDGLQYFWVDTCCIDKSDAIVLQTAINSMFRWYHDAERCYVYLPDVDSTSTATSAPSSMAWEEAFRKSRWFTRGWTLQELIAPPSVEFYSKGGVRLGDKRSLETLIRDITNIPAKALRGTPLSDFTVSERETWAHNRQTTYEEDMAYCLLGMFDTYMPLLYGEGRARAQRRLREEIQKAVNGKQAKDFSVSLSVSEVLEIKHFVARREELAEMRRALSSDGSRRIVSLHGLGGIGKTQLAVAYTKRFRDEYSAIFWLNIKDETSIQRSFAKVARQILQQHPNASHLRALSLEENDDDVIEAVKAWLSLPDNTRWLVVYDNYDNPKLSNPINTTSIDIQRYFPTADQGSIIITTRLSQVDIGHRIRIKKLIEMEDSLEILSTTSRRDSLKKDTDVRRLIEKLDGLPLALATAGAYLGQVSINLANYLRHYEKSWTRIHADTPELGSYQDRTISSTWQISYEHIKAQDPLAAQLLQWWAYFDNEDIWFELLQPPDDDYGGLPWLQELTDELNFNRSMGILHNYGFVEPHSLGLDDAGSRGYSIHSCLHSWTVHVLNHNWDNDLGKLALRCVASHVPSKNDSQFWVLQRRLLLHAMKSCGGKIDVSDANLAWAFHKFGNLYSDQGKLQKAEQMFSLALRGKEKQWGPDHTSTLDTVNNLGLIYTDQGKMREGEEMYLRALRGYENALGADHTSTLNTVNNLGILYKAQGQLQKAEDMYLRALDGKEQAWGPDHTSTLDTVNNLGNLYTAQDKMQKAEEMYLRALRGYENVWGLDHTSTLFTINNLGNLYKNQGKIQEAEKMYLRALDGKEKAWGPDHTSTLDTVNNLGLLYADQGKMQEAEEMYLRALRGFENAWGTDHTSTLDTANNLGLLYADQDKMQKAEEMYLRALRGYEKQWGPDHISTLDTVGNLGNLYKNQGKMKEAEEMYLRALRGYENAFGPDHTSTLNTVNNLGTFYADQGQLQKAEETYLRALEGKERAYGPDHTSTLNTVNNLGLLYATQGQLQRAEEMYSRALEGYERVCGPDHASTLRTINNLGVLYKTQGQLQKAEVMCLRALKGKEKALGPNHTSTLNTVNNLGVLYANQGQLQKAEDMYLRALEGKEKAWGPDHASTLDTVNNLGNIYKARGKLQKAEEMYSRALKGKEKQWGPDHISTLDIVNNLGVLYADQGKLQKAEEMYLRALEGKEKACGLDHTSTLNTVNNLGLLYATQDNMQDAEEMYLRALEGYEKARGLDHTSTLSTVNNLGILYANQGKLQKAEEMYLRALRGYENALGQVHTSTLDTVGNLGNLYEDQGKLQEAEEMYMRALEGKEKTWGPAHTSTLSTVNNLGNLYKTQGKLQEAEEMYARALRGYEKACGPDHTSTLETVNNLGVLYKTQGQLQKAEVMYVRALKGYENAFGTDHTSTLSTVNNLGILYKAQGHLQKAEAMYLRALEGYEKGVSPETLITFRPAVNATWNLGIISLAQSKLVEGRKLCNQALIRLEKLHEISHPDVSSWREFVTKLNEVPPGSLAVGPITGASLAGEEEGGILPTSASKKKRRDALKAVFRRFNK